MRVAIWSEILSRSKGCHDIYNRVPDYFKRPAQVEATGSSCLPTCVPEVLKIKERVALMEYCTPFQFNRDLLSLCIGSGSLVF